MVLSVSLEFCRHFNKDVVERPSDDMEVPRINQLLPEKVLDKKKQDIYQRPYAAKARTLLHAHLYRMHEELGANTLLLGETASR